MSVFKDFQGLENLEKNSRTFKDFQGPARALPPPSTRTLNKWQLPGHGKDVTLYVQLMRIAHDPVSEVFHQLVTELHLLSECEVITS